MKKNIKARVKKSITKSQALKREENDNHLSLKERSVFMKEYKVPFGKNRGLGNIDEEFTNFIFS